MTKLLAQGHDLLGSLSYNRTKRNTIKEAQLMLAGAEQTHTL